MDPISYQKKRGSSKKFRSEGRSKDTRKEIRESIPQQESKDQKESSPCENIEKLPKVMSRKEKIMNIWMPFFVVVGFYSTLLLLVYYIINIVITSFPD